MDEIQQKLKLIDEQISGGRNFHREIISTAPLLFAAFGLITGVLVQNTFDLPVRLWLTLLAFAAIATVIFFAQKKSAPYLVAYTTLVCFTCLGAVRFSSYHYAGPDNIRNLVGNERKLATIRGTIVTEPYVNNNQQWAFSKFTHTDPTSSFYLKIHEVEAVSGWAKVTGTVRVQVDEPLLDLKAGDYIQAYCWLDKFNGPGNPGQFDVSQYIARKNVYITASVASRAAIEVLGGNSTGGFLIQMKKKAQKIAVQSLLGSPDPQNEGEILLQALVIGYRADMDHITCEAFRKTGLLHFVCLSGMNFGILVGMIWWMCKTAGLMKQGRAAVCIIAAAMFVLVVPSNPPALRAAIMCLVFCSSFFFRRQSNSSNSLALAAIVLLMINPTDLFDVSWQLSFASVIGIILFTDRIENFIYEKGTDWFGIKERQKTKGFLRIIPDPRSLFAISLAAWLASAGILLYNFYTVQPLTSIWTVIASPFIAVISFLGYLKLLVGLVLPTTASIMNVLIKPLSSWLIELVKYIAQRDFSQVLIGHVSVWLVVFYYCVISFIAFIHFQRPFVKKVISVLMVLAIIIFLGITKWQRTHRDNLVITCLDVSHGQAVLVELPGQTNYLFDAGSLYIGNIGERIVSSFLDYKGISRLDYVVISHNDIDHLNGIPEIVENCSVGGVYANDAFFSEIDQWGTEKFLNTLLNKKGIKIQPIKENLKTNSAATIKILWPNEQIYPAGELSDNDKSTVMLIEFAGTGVLLCSDIEKFAQKELMRLFSTLKPMVIIVPHHGSVKTSEPDFLKKLDASVLIYSCGQRQYETQQNIEQTEKANSFYTYRDGAITVSASKNGIVRTEVFCKTKK